MSAALDIYDPDYIRGLPASAELDHRQAAVFLRISPGRLYNICSAGGGPRKIEKRGRVYYVKADLAAWDKDQATIIPAHSRR
jgi:hypothetical protein